MRHRFAALVAVSTALLIFAGGLVTSTESGLSVPDWPTTYGYSMFTFPLSKMVGGIRYEHTHRLIASTVGFLIIVLAVWLWRAEPRRWVRRLGYIALAAVITQGLLGGLTVLYLLPDPISIAHASLAQIVFSLTMTIAVVTSPGWMRGYAPARPERATPIQASRGAPDDRVLQRIAIVTAAAVYIQIIVGATMRHTGAGLAIPDFPFAFGHLIPPHWDEKIAIHFAHRVGALIATACVLATTAHVFYHHRDRVELVRPSILLLALVATQVTLGALTVLSRKDVLINSLHVVTGGCVLATTVVLALRAHRARFAASTSARSKDPAYTEQDPAYDRSIRNAGPIRPAGDHA
jgi:cytochrome c oxidase assembly protein subunit 15